MFIISTLIPYEFNVSRAIFVVDLRLEINFRFPVVTVLEREIVVGLSDVADLQDGRYMTRRDIYSVCVVDGRTLLCA